MLEATDSHTTPGDQLNVLLQGATASRPAAATQRRMTEPRLESGRIAIVDDELINVKVARKYLCDAGFTDCHTITDPERAVSWLREVVPDLVLLDIVMPGVSGLEILKSLRADPQMALVPVLILTAIEDHSVKASALQLGASDFLHKPVDPNDLIPRVRNSLAVRAKQKQLEDYAHELEARVLERTAELAASRLEIVYCLARAAEYRDNDTGKHVVRVGRYAGLIAQKLGVDRGTLELIELAAPLHDVGKIGIPDAILRKPGKLSTEEFRYMQQHCDFGQKIFDEITPEQIEQFARHTVFGAEFIGQSRSPILQMAAVIAATHHERWDGTGYPNRLRGEQIPLAGRIVAVADVFDALSSQRPYKPALPLEQCFGIIEEGRDGHFDPAVLDAFNACRADVLNVYFAHRDTDTTASHDAHKPACSAAD